MIWPAVLLSMTVPAALILPCPVLRALARRKPATWVGYRTRRALMNQANWSAAQIMSARLLAQIGVTFAVLMALAFLVLVAIGNQDEDTWYSVGGWAGIAVVPAMCWVFSHVESHLTTLPSRRSSDTEPSGDGPR